MQTSSYWERVNRRDRRAIVLADKHYSREVIGAPQVGGSAALVVLVTPAGDACWITSYQKHPTHQWRESWVCTLFRNESRHLSSALITDAVAVTRQLWGDPLRDGFITFVDRRRVRPKRDPGYCYLVADPAWRRVEDTKVQGLTTLQLDAERFPAPMLPIGALDFYTSPESAPAPVAEAEV